MNNFDSGAATLPRTDPVCDLVCLKPCNNLFRVPQNPTIEENRNAEPKTCHRL
jgi:hypothetical protein